MPERERAESLSLEEERHDPDALYRMLKGGFSAGSGKRYAGLGQEVLKRITEIYAVPKPQGYSSDSRARGEERWEPRGSNHEADALDLAVRLTVFMDEPIEGIEGISRDELLNLTKRATERAITMVRTRRGQAGPSVGNRARALELVQTYLAWLGRSCDHKNARRGGSVEECPDCGAVRIDV